MKLWVSDSLCFNKHYQMPSVRSDISPLNMRNVKYLSMFMRFRKTQVYVLVPHPRIKCIRDIRYKFTNYFTNYYHDKSHTGKFKSL